MIKYLLLPLLSIHILYADMLGGEVSLGLFNHTPSGQTSYRLPTTATPTSVNLEDTLGWSDTQDIVFKIYLEHPLPLFPNIKLGHTTLSHDGTQTVAQFNWGDINNFTGQLKSDLTLSMSDARFYYELLDNWVELDVGLTIRYLSGEITLHNIATNTSIDFSSWIPMIYAKTHLNFPTDADISLQFEINANTYSGTMLYDYEFSARYTFLMNLGLEAGYKAVYLDSDHLTSGLKTDIGFSGIYAAIVWDC